MAVAADAIHLLNSVWPCGDRGRVVVVERGARVERRRGAAAGINRVGAFARGDGFADRLGAAVAFLAVARAERERGGAEDQAASAEA